jgi:pyruvate kinase
LNTIDGQRRTRIIVTLGPSTDPPAHLVGLLEAGADVARINFSHGTVEDHIQRIRAWRRAAAQAGRLVGVLADLPGPKLRLLLPTTASLRPGDWVYVTPGDDWQNIPHVVGVTEPQVLAEIRPGQRLLVDDGRMQWEAVGWAGKRLAARVVVGGVLSPNKGLNLPDTRLSLPALTERDQKALEVAAAEQVDWVALSFVRHAAAAEAVRGACAAVGLHVPVLAKIERPEAVEEMESILQAFDGIMVARGDLGVEIPLEQVPMVQKRLIAWARAIARPVIIATDMLDSMRNNPRPTRAEVSDVANAICDGTDAVMLSGETAVGQYPVEAVRYMVRIAQETERHMREGGVVLGSDIPAASIPSQDEPLTATACRLAAEEKVAALIIPTVTGRTARLVARHRPWTRIIAVASRPAVLQQLTLSWGVTGVLMRSIVPGQDRIAAAVADAFHAHVITPGERVVVIAGHPIEGGPRYPTLRLLRVGPAGQPVEP